MTNPLELADLKALLGIDASDTSQDNVLNLALNAAWSYIKNYCNRDFIAQDYTETQYFNLSQRDFVVLRHYPVNSVTSLKIDGVTISSDYYELDSESGIITLKFNYLLDEDTDEGIDYCKAEISYNAGYTYDENTNEIKTELSDLYYAGLQLAAMKYYSFAQGRLGLKAIHAGGETVNIQDIDEGLPMEIKVVLDKYKRKL